MLKIKCTLIEELLGSSSGDPQIHREFIASKSADATKIEEEVAAIGVEAATEKAMTVFPHENGIPFLWDYQIKGLFKGAAKALSELEGTLSRKAFVKTNKEGEVKVSRVGYQRLVDLYIFPHPRKILLHLPEGAKIGSCQRPLLGMTRQGERVSLANSESVPVGTYWECEVECLNSAHEPLVEEWLNYARLGGFLQWRNSGKGRFTWEKI